MPSPCTLTLYTTLLSANGRKVVAACRALDLDVELRWVNVYRGEGRSPEFLRLNPSGKIPVLVDGDLTLSESNAIMLYLSDRYGRSDRHEGSKLSGSDLQDRARVTSWMFWEASEWQPALTDVLRPHVGHALLPDTLPAPSEPPHWAAPELVPLLARLEQHLSVPSSADATPKATQRGVQEAPRFLVGNQISLADLAVAGMMTYFEYCGFPSHRYPAISRWYTRLSELPAWRSTRVAPWEAPSASSST